MIFASTFAAGLESRGTIPLVQGLVVTVAAHDADADYESLLTYSAVTPEFVEISSVARKAGSDGKPVFASSRRIFREDLKSSHRLVMTLQTGDPDSFPGSTLTSLSADVVHELDDNGESTFIVGSAKLDKCIVEIDGNAISDLLFAQGRKYYRGPLRVNPAGLKSYSVLVNGERKSLPALSVRADLHVGDDHVQPEFIVLDDPDNALILADSSANASCSARVVRIDFPSPANAASTAVTTLDQSLSKGACRAELHGIYFATASSELLPQSSSTLADIAALLQKHADWSLAIEGHTDNIGTPAYNLDLSNRRATAVQQALTGRYHVAASRLSAHGFGLTKPIESNETLEGRARNRRVEIARQCQ